MAMAGTFYVHPYAAQRQYLGSTLPPQQHEINSFLNTSQLNGNRRHHHRCRHRHHRRYHLKYSLSRVLHIKHHIDTDVAVATATDAATASEALMYKFIQL